MITVLVYCADVSSVIPNEYKIGMGTQETCFTRASKTVEAIYVYVPITLMLIANTAFYCVTAYRIYQVQKTSQAFRRSSNVPSKFELDRFRSVEVSFDNRFLKITFSARFSLYFRLFIIMGATWIIEILSWAFLRQNDLISAILHVSDVLNCVQGILIFIMFVWTEKVKKMIARKLCGGKNVLAYLCIIYCSAILLKVS